MTISKIILTAFLLTVLFYCSCSSQREESNVADSSQPISTAEYLDTSANEVYVGVEYKHTITDPSHPRKVFKLFYLSYLKIKDDSVFLDQSPIFVHKKDTTYSASTGGFFYYNGTMINTDKTILFNLKELFCDYCARPIEIEPDGSKQPIQRYKQLKGLKTKDGFLINGYLFKKVVINEELISEFPEHFMK